MLTNDRRLYLCALLMDMIAGAVVFVVPRRAADMGVDSGTVGMLLCALFLAYTVFAPLMGGFSDRFSRRGLMMLGCVISLAVVLGSALVTDGRLLLALMALFGLALAMYWPPKIAWLSHGKTGRRLAASLAIFSLAYNAGFLLANAGAGALYYASITVPDASPAPEVPADLRGKFSWNAAARRWTLRGTLTEGQAHSIRSLNPAQPTAQAFEQLVWRSRHRPLPLLAAAAIPIVILVLLVLPVAAPASNGPLDAGDGGLSTMRDAERDADCAEPVPTIQHAAHHASPAPSAHVAGEGALMHGRVLLWTAWMGSFASTFIGSGTRAVFPGLASALDIAPDVHGLLAAGVQAAAVTTFVLMQVWYGWHGRVWPLLAAQALAATGVLLIASGATPGVFAAGFLLMGVNNGYCIFASQCYTMELFAPECKGRGSGLSEAIFGSGLFLGPIAAGMLGQAVTARAAFVFLAAVLIFLMAVSALLAIRQAVDERARRRGRRAASPV